MEICIGYNRDFIFSFPYYNLYLKTDKTKQIACCMTLQKWNGWDIAKDKTKILLDDIDDYTLKSI